MDNRRSISGPPGQSQHSQHRPQNSFGGSVPIPTGQSNAVGRQRNGSLASQQQFKMGKSPPNQQSSNKNTKHVPCKFFRQGACQAGQACPFFHTLDPMSLQAPCKYFMKGNCKFGAKCVLAHYLPNGHRVSKADLAPVNPQRYGPQISEESNFFPSHDVPPQEQYDPSSQNGFYSDYPFLDDDFDPVPERANGRPYNPVVGSPPTSHFGSPPNDAFSPVPKIHSALNAPLPPSWSGSVPHYAKFGPFGASVPDKFGSGSPATSTISQQLSPPSRDVPLKQAQSSGLRNSQLGSSPAMDESSIGQRIMTAQRILPRSTMPVSASVPVQDLHFGEFGTESPFLPADLQDELFVSGQGRQRLSRHEDVSGSFKEMSEGLAIPRHSSNTVGSPPTSGSPSRFKALFEEQQKQKSAGVGVVGSPLRESWMPDGDRSGQQISGISQAMARMGLDRDDSTDSNTVRPTIRSAGYGRQISSPGLSSQRIDEEGEGAFFPMDADDGSKRTNPVWIESQKNRATEQQSRSNPNRPIFGFNT